MAENLFKQFLKDLEELSNSGRSGNTERTYYPPFINFLKPYFELLGGVNIEITAEVSSGKDIGLPDLTVFSQNKIIGCIEVKRPEDNLNKKAFEGQFNKYKDNLENVVFTNFKQWELWQWDGERKSVKIDEIYFDVFNYPDSKEARPPLDELFTTFLNKQIYPAKTARDLASALAKKTKILRQAVENTFDEKDRAPQLNQLKKVFEKTLIQNLTPHQFANLVAETIAYSLFLATLEYLKNHPGQREIDLTINSALESLPANIPVLKDLYDLVNKVSNKISSIRIATEFILGQLKNSDLEKIRQEITKQGDFDDPVIPFYEPFLKEYDEKVKKIYGVYYTPKPVVDFIVRNIDYLLREKFGRKDGLAEKDVTILDPATGTATFLISAIQQVKKSIENEYKTLGKELAEKKFIDLIPGHILKNFYGFELMLAPYAIAHLKLTLALDKIAQPIEPTFKLEKNSRFQIFLANTLGNPEVHSQTNLFGFDAIPEESEQAKKVKKDQPILAIMGNPPYAGISQNPVDVIIENKKVKTWIGDLIEDYKYSEGDRNKGLHFNERKHWLGDDYVKFIRFCHWKITQTQLGVIGLITNNGFLDNPTFRGMRYQLMESFDEIYSLNLHGSTTKKESAPDGSKDENVFDIMTGVGITFFVKHSKEKKEKCKIHSADLYGLRKNKFNFLNDNDLQSISWQELKPAKPNYFFIKKDRSLDEEYFKYWSITDVFPKNVTGIVTARDKLVINIKKENLISRILEFSNLSKSDDAIRNKFFPSVKKGKYLPGDTRGWKISEVRKIINKENHLKNIKSILYRPFDIRSIYYHPKMVDWGREKIMRNFLVGDNLGLCLCRQFKSGDIYQHCFVSNILIESSCISNRTSEIANLFPLYLYPEKEQRDEYDYYKDNLLTKREANINPKFIEALTSQLGYTPTPEAVFYYAYAVFHSPSYRSRYQEQLKIDFPRLPLPSRPGLFKQLTKFGRRLVNFHLLGHNPFDESANNLFSDKSKWGVTVGSLATLATLGSLAKNKAKPLSSWKIEKVEYRPIEKRVYINSAQYVAGLDEETWEFRIGGYQVLDKWLKDRGKDRGKNKPELSSEDLEHYLKIVVSLRETKKIMQEIDGVVPSWPELAGWSSKV